MITAKRRGQAPATERDEMLRNGTEVKPLQLAVLDQLMAGRSISEAARSADVARSTVHRWLKEDFAFQAELNRLRHELRESVEGALLAAAVRAAQTVVQAVEDGDVSVSIKLLKGVGALSGHPNSIGSDDPDVVRQEDELARQAEESDRKLRWLATAF
jgi:hypothetical protein